MPPLIVESRFVGFLDILGWASRVAEDLPSTIALYDELLTKFGWVSNSSQRAASLRVFSDSILVVSETLQPVLQAANSLQFLALTNDCLLRGGIAFGQHAERAESGQLHVVSEPLVLAARIEKSIRVPAVGLHPSALPPLDLGQLKLIDSFERSLLYFGGQWIVNPFNIMWGTSAATRVEQLRERYPAHRDKYDWFLELYNEVCSRAPLVP